MLDRLNGKLIVGGGENQTREIACLSTDRLDQNRIRHLG